MDSCFHSVGLPSERILWVFQSVADTGYAAIELNAETLPWAGPHVSPDTPAALRHEIVAAAAQHRLRIPAIGAHTEMVGEDAKARAQAIGFVKGCIDLAVDLGAPVVHILSGPLPRAVSEDQAQAWFNDAVAETVIMPHRCRIPIASSASGASRNASATSRR
jgi:sugar phosphate isomerase/epimerase